MPSKKITSVEPDRMIMFQDLIEDSTGNILHDVGILYYNKSYKTRPSKCPHCRDIDIEAIEVLGAYIGTLLWNCENCGYMFMRFGKKETENRLK